MSPCLTCSRKSHTSPLDSFMKALQDRGYDRCRRHAILMGFDAQMTAEDKQAFARLYVPEWSHPDVSSPAVDQIPVSTYELSRLADDGNPNHVE